MNRIIISAMLAAVVLSSCTDDELDCGPYPEHMQSRTAIEVTIPGGLIQQADGTWKSENCRVPIVGPGRVINEINSSTVNVIGVSNGALDNIVDADLTNSCNIPAAISAGVAYTPIVSVKDIYHVYSAGQKVGFVYKDTEAGGAKLLTLDVLKGMTLETYLKGQKQESTYTADETSTLKLDLLSFNVGDAVADRVLSFDAGKPFDEVRLSFTGVDATVASNIALAVKYAFVGENPEIRATSEPEFSGYWTGGKPEVSNHNIDIFSKDNLVDEDLSNSAPFTSQLGFRSYARINLKRTIPVGTEIGFYYNTNKILGLDLFGQAAPTLTSYDKNNAKVEESTPSTSLLSLSLIGFSGKTLTNMVTTAECSQIEFKHPVSLLNVGGMNVFYAYIREGVKLDPANYFTFGDDITYNYSYRLPQASQGNVTYTILSQPYGSEPSVQNSNILTGMSKDGAYRVQAFYTAEDGCQLSHIATIYHKSAYTTSGCNKYITTQSHGAYAVEALGWNGCLLCLFNGSNNINNVVDMSTDNYATVNQLASVLEWTPVAAFKMNTPVSAAGKVRAGFVVQANTMLLDLSALSFFKIKLYDGNTLVNDDVTTENSSVHLSLIGSSNDKVRLSVETDKSFDRIELWRKGVADVLTSMRIYNIFYEDSSCDESSGMGGCMELMTNLKDDLQIDYNKTLIGAGLISLGNTFKNLDYLLDGSMETGALLNDGVSLGGSTIALKFRKQKANQSVGLVFGSMGDLLSVNLSNVGELKVYNGDSKVASTADFDILGANLISHGGYTYVEVTPEQEFDRIEFTVGGLKLLNTSKICGVFIRPDSDGDGIPNCADTDDDSEKLEIEDGTFHTCYGSPLNIPVSGAPTITDLSIWCYNQETKDDITCNASIAGGQIVIPAKAIPVGRYLFYIYSADGNQLLAYDIDGIVHPQETTWKTDASSADWNEWKNWTDGSPWACTNVVIPSNAALYPELANSEKNYCHNIHFEDGAEVVGTHNLTMNGMAFVDKSVQGGRYYLLSAPLQEMFTGDMFISPDANWSKDKYFTALTAGNYKESRNRPIVYQHFWSGVAIEKDENLNGTDVGTAQWSADFNAVNTKYVVGQGFLLKAGTSTDRSSYTFRFPKTHGIYTYFRSDGTSTGKTEAINRVAGTIGKFAMTIPGTVTLANKESGTVFLMGNPFMAHLDVSKLMEANPGIEEIRVCNGNSYNRNETVESQTVSSKYHPNLLVAPMEAFFVVVKNEAKSLSVALNESMLTQKHKPTQKAKR